MNALYREIADALRPVIREELRAELERQKEPPSPYMSVAEAAKVFGVTSRTIRRWVADGSIESTRRGGKLLIPREAGR